MKTMMVNGYRNPNGSIWRNSSNVTYNCMNIELETDEWLLVAAFLFILVVGVLGNAFVIYVFGYRRRKVGRSTTEWLILLLGITDFLSTIFNCLLYLYWTLTKHRCWAFGAVGCKILPAIGPILTTASAGLILIFAIDRYIAIVQPFRGQLMVSTAKKAFLVDILLSILTWVHYMYNISLKNGRCSLKPPTDLHYGIPNCALIILRLTVFGSIFMFTSIRIFYKLRENENRATVRTKSNGPIQKREKRQTQSKAIARVLFVVGLVFILLVFPRELFYLIINMSHLTSNRGININRLLLHINSWLKVMHTANCCANVFIYAHLHSRFRRIILNTINCYASWKQDLPFVTFSTQLSRYNSMKTKSSSDRHPLQHDEESCL